MNEKDANWFKPLWRRVAVTAVVIVWFVWRMWKRRAARLARPVAAPTTSSARSTE